MGSKDKKDNCNYDENKNNSILGHVYILSMKNKMTDVF